MGKKLEQALAEAEEIEAAEADHTERPIPPHVNVTRPNRARSRVLQVRLSPEEFAAVERMAAKRGLPASTVAREKLLELVATDDDAKMDFRAQFASLIAQMNGLLAQLSSAGPTVGLGERCK